MNEFLIKLKSFNGFVGSVSVLIPGFAFFMGYAPPLYSKISFLVSAISAAFLWFGYNNRYKDKSKLFHLAFRFIVTGFIVSLFYVWLLDKTTAEFQDTNTKQSIRYQLGYNIASWSLTPAADSIRVKDGITSNEELFKECQVQNENIPKIWKPFWVDFFGITNILLFCFSSILWSYGWGILIKTS